MITTICDGNTCDDCKRIYGRYRCDSFLDHIHMLRRDKMQSGTLSGKCVFGLNILCQQCKVENCIYGNR